MSFIYKIIKQKGLNHKKKSNNNNIQRWVGFGHFIKVGGGGGMVENTVGENIIGAIVQVDALNLFALFKLIAITFKSEKDRQLSL